MMFLASPVFKVMMEGNFSEARKSADEPIDLKDISAAAFQQILE